MATLNPQLNTGVSFEQPVETPSLLSGVAGIAGAFIPTKTTVAKPSAKELEGAALRPFTKRLDDIFNSDLSDSDKKRQARRLGKDYIVNNPEYRDGATDVLSNYNVTIQAPEVDLESSYVDNVQNFLGTVEGQQALVEATVFGPNGQVDEVATLNNVEVKYQQDLAHKADIKRTSEEMQLSQDDATLWKNKSTRKVTELSSGWLKKSENYIDSVTKLALSGDPSVDTPEEQLAWLRSKRAELHNTFVSDATAAGLHPSAYKTGEGSKNIATALTPIDTMIQLMESNTADATMFFNATQTAAKQDALINMIDFFGSQAALPAFQDAIMPMIAQQAYKEDTSKFLSDMSINIDMGALNVFEVGSEVSDETLEKNIDVAQASDPETKQKIVEVNTAALNSQGSGDHTTDSRMATTNFKMLRAANARLGGSVLSQVYNPVAVNSVSEIIAKGDAFAAETKEAYTNFASEQLRMNMEFIADNTDAGVGLGTRMVNGVLHATKDGVIFDRSGLLNTNEQNLLKAVKNVNTINSNSKTILGMKDEEPSTVLPFQNLGLTGEGGDNEVGGSQGGDTLESTVSPTDLIAGFEGFSHGAYWDVNAYRAGFGSDTITRADGTVEKITETSQVTRQDAQRDLARRTQEFQNKARAKVGGETWDKLPGNVTAALTSIAYNYGSIPDRLLESIRSGDIESIATAVEGLGSDNDGINKERRGKEAALIRGKATPPRPPVSEYSPRPEARPEVFKTASAPVEPTIRPVARPEPQTGEITLAQASTSTGSTEKPTPSPSTEPLKLQTDKLLDKLGLKEDEVHRFTSEEDVRKAIQDGSIGIGDVIILNGQVIVL